jgi:RHS repeat-associated protein
MRIGRKNILPGETGVFTGKDLDAETGLYYYGVRCLDLRTSRWLSGDPAVGDYTPGAPVDDEALE